MIETKNSRKENQPQANPNPVNYEIKASQVRIVSGDKPLVLSLGDALRQAEADDLDLIQIAMGGDNIPVCRLERFDKFLYQKQKADHQKLRDQRESAKRNDVKELQIRVGIESHDLQIKIQQAKNFFQEGRRVKWVLKFRGREMTHLELGQNIFDQITESLGILGTSTPVQKEGKLWQQVWQPKS